MCQDDETQDDYNERLRAAAVVALTDDDRSRILDEEGRAWAIGRAKLEDLGFEHLDSVDEHARLGLHRHRYRLGIEELWPEDEDDAARDA